MAPKQQLDKSAWQWAETTDPESVTTQHIATAYRLGLEPCKQGVCRRNCKGNPHCLVNLGEKEWLVDREDSHWNDIEDPELERRKQGEFVGLKNLGATCYVNTYLQLWFHNLFLRATIMKLEETTDAPIESGWMENFTFEEQQRQLMPSTVAGHLQLIFVQLQHSVRKNLDPTPFINCLGLDAAQQQDAQEFSKLFLSLLEDTLSLQPNPAARELVQKQFMGNYHYLTVCRACGAESRCASSFYELDLHIKGHKHLSECIDEFLKEEQLEGENKYMCSGCSQKQNAIRRIQLKSLPPVLNIQLLRFVFDRNTGHKKKLNTYIQFPEVLDMSQYLGVEEGTRVYDLHAVLIHRGPSAYSGHYIAHIRDQSSGSWYKFNDEEIEQMTGKGLHLGKDEEISEPTTKNGEKKPKTTKGFHASRNAYMLVYYLRQDGNTVSEVAAITELPWRVRQCFELDNQSFEEWVNNISNIRSENVRKGKVRQQEVRETFSRLQLQREDEIEWLPQKWLTKWFTAEKEDKVPEINMKPFLCPHQRLDPDKVNDVKCVSSASADILHNRFKGSVRLKGTESLCESCVKERCRSIRTKSRINEDSKLIGALLKGQGQTAADSIQEGFWVGKSSLRSWKRLAMERMAAEQQEREARSNGLETLEAESGPDEAEKTSKNGTDTTVPNTAQDKEQPESSAAKLDESIDSTAEDRLQFNEDILCEPHGLLIVEEGCRRLVPTEIWQRLKLYFPQAPEFRDSCSPCQQCRDQVEREQQEKSHHKVMASELKSKLLDLYIGRNRPVWRKDVVQLYVVTADFLDAWRRFVKDPLRCEPPVTMSNSAVICPHGGFLFHPETIGHNARSQILEFVRPEDWETLKTFIIADVEILVCRIEEDDGHVTFVVQPDICRACIEDREEFNLQSRLCYDGATIFVRKLTSDHRVMSTLDDDKIAENLLESGASSEAADDTGFQSGQSVKRKKGPDALPSEKMVKLDSEPARRSGRHRKMRGEKDVIVSSTQTLRDLKLQVMKLFSVAPFDQHLHMNGQELRGDKDTLASLRILPGSVLYLKADEPMDDPIFLEEPKDGATEEGFKGTGLVSR